MKNVCCILCYQHRLQRLMMSPILGRHHERLREPRKDLTEQDTGIRHHQRLHRQLPHHAHQRATVAPTDSAI